MGLSVSSWCLALGLTLWLVGERVLSASGLRTGFGILSASCFALALVLDAATLRKREPEARAGLGYRWLSAALMAASAVIYAGLGFAGFARADSLWTWSWLLPLLLGLPARLAADRAFRSGPFDGARLAMRARAGLLFGLLLNAVAVVNYFAAIHDVRKDFSYHAANEPSAQVRELVTTLEEPVTLLLLFEQGNEVLPAAKPYFDALARISPRLTVRVQDAALTPELLQKHKVRGNGFGLLLAGDGDGQRGESFYIGDDLRDARRVLKTLDAHIANHLSVLARPVRPVYLTTGHGERSVAGDVEEARGRYLRDFERLLARFNVRTHRLGGKEGLTRAVPEDAAAVLVLGPERPFLEEEAAALEAYVMRGGRLWLGLEPGVDAGLSSLLMRAGITAAGPAVLCNESFVVRSRTLADKALIQTQRYASHPVTQGVRKRSTKPQVVMVRATALALATPSLAKQRVVVMQSERDCFLDSDADFAAGPSEPTQSYPLLVASVLAGTGGADGRIVVSGDGDVPTDQVLRNEANTLLTLGIMRWLVGDEAMLAVASLQDDLPVLHQRTEDRVWFYLSAFAVPAPLFLVAIWLWRKRQMRPSAAR